MESIRFSFFHLMKYKIRNVKKAYNLTWLVILTLIPTLGKDGASSIPVESAVKLPSEVLFSSLDSLTSAIASGASTLTSSTSDDS